MDRREALKKTSLVVGYSLTTSLVGVTLHGCAEAGVVEQSKASTPKWSPEFLSDDQARLVAEICEIFLPETDTPGARSARVHEYVDEELQYMLPVRDQHLFLTGLQDIDARSRASFGHEFVECSLEERKAVLAALEEASTTADGELDEGTFYAKIKSLTYKGYYTSELVCKKVLRYDPVPGEYLGCIEIDPGAPAWTL